MLQSLDEASVVNWRAGQYQTKQDPYFIDAYQECRRREALEGLLSIDPRSVSYRTHLAEQMQNFHPVASRIPYEQQRIPRRLWQGLLLFWREE